MSTIASEQLVLDLAPITEPTYDREATLAERFAVFHAANPHVAHALEGLAGQWLNRHHRVGIGMLFEALRWQSGLSTTGDQWRLNNSYRSHYARLLIERRPEWAAAIETRHLRAA